MKYSFSSLNLDDNLISSLAKIGIINPSHVQYNFIESSIDETSIIFQSKSGTGKTVSYCISLINKIIQRKNVENQYNNIDSLNISQFKNYSEISFGDAVIIVPTRELSYQIYFFFLSLSHYIEIIKPILLVGSSNVLKVLNYMKKNNVNIVISTPGRIKTILRSKPSKSDIAKYGLKSNHSFFKTHLLIFDEADMLLDDHFFEQTKFICSKLCNPFVQVVAVSATFLKPQFKAFEDMIYELDKMYVEKLINNVEFRKNNKKENKENNKIEDVDNTNKDKNNNNTENTKGEKEQVFVEPRLGYYVNHLLISKKIKDIDLLSNYVDSYKRKFLKIILSTSYLSRMLDLKSLRFGQESYFITSETTQTLETNFEYTAINNNINNIENNNIEDNNNENNKENEEEKIKENKNNKENKENNKKEEEEQNNKNKINNGSITLVLDKVDFYVAVVRDAPNIVMQIGLKIEVVVRVLSCTKYNKCIIFCNQSHTRIQTYKLLQSLGYCCYINSSRVSPSERVKTLYDLNTIDKVVILCTDLMSRGIGFSNVDLVINMDIPSTKEVFLHRSGRSGRFGSTGICVTICMESEIDTYEYFLYSLNFNSLPVENIYNKNKNKENKNDNKDENQKENKENINKNNKNKENENNNIEDEEKEEEDEDYIGNDINYEFDLSDILKVSIRPERITEINVDVSSLVGTKELTELEEVEGLIDTKEVERSTELKETRETKENNKRNKEKERNQEKPIEGKELKETNNMNIDESNNLIIDVDYELDVEELIKGFMKQRISFCESVET